MTGKARIARRKEELARIFKMALRQEKSAQKLYQKAITNCDDEDWKSLLAGLRADEARHEQELLELHKELTAFLELQEAAGTGTGEKAATKKAAFARNKKKGTAPAR
jgi:rubrerythrin